MTSILVVDDDPIIRDVVQMVLVGNGLDVDLCVTGLEAVRSAHDAPPDCAVVDVSMPDMSGLEVCRALREDALTSDVPIILLTGRSQWLDVASGFAAGADDYLVKPFTAEDLINRIEALIG